MMTTEVYRDRIAFTLETYPRGRDAGIELEVTYHLLSNSAVGVEHSALDHRDGNNGMNMVGSAYETATVVYVRGDGVAVLHQRWEFDEAGTAKEDSNCTELVWYQL